MSKLGALLKGIVLGVTILLLCCVTVRAETIIIDNGETGTSFTGSWPVSGGLDSYGDSSLYNKVAGDTYTFGVAVNGTREVSLWWTEWSSRSTNVPVEIYDGSALIDTVSVNQQVQGGQWNILGTYTFADNPRIMVVSEGNGSTCADAVRVEMVEQVETIEMTVKVTWDRPENAGDWAGLWIRVNGDDSTIIDIADPEPTTWTGTLVLSVGENVFEMLAYDAGGQHSVWSEPAYFTPDQILNAPMGISVEAVK